MPLRDQDRAAVYVDWGDGEEDWYRPDRDVVTCQQAANKGIEPDTTNPKEGGHA